MATKPRKPLSKKPVPTLLRLFDKLEPIEKRLRGKPEDLRPSDIVKFIEFRAKADEIANTLKTPKARGRWLKIVNVMFSDPRTGKRLPRDPEQAARVLIAPPQLYIKKVTKQTGEIEVTFVPAPDPGTVVQEKVETRFQASFLIRGHGDSVCNATSYVSALKDGSLREVIAIAGEAFARAARTGLRGELQAEHQPWKGHATVNGGCAGTFALFLATLADSPGRVQDPVYISVRLRQFFGEGVTVFGELLISWRRVVDRRSRRGDVLSEKFVLVNRNDIRIPLGEGLLPDTRTVSSR